MTKKLFLITLITTSLLIAGCSNTQTTSQQSTKTNSQLPSNTISTPKTTPISKVGSNNANNTATTNTNKKWNGTFTKGTSDVAGDYGTITITNSNDKQFVFSFFATYSTKVKGQDGKEYLNAHMGQIDDFAYFTSTNEAYYTNKDYPDYKMIFKLNNNNTITVTEINTKTNEDYGRSPDAGANVRFAGDYTLKK